MTSATPPSDGQPSDGDGSGVRSGLTASFLTTLGREIGAEGLTPAAMTRAVSEVLHVDGASLTTMTSILRLPLGSSSDDARRAEELQASLWEGPYQEAAASQSLVVAGGARLETRWPLYAEQLVTKTPFRSVASLPLRAPGQNVFAALDVYSAEALDGRLDAEQVQEVATTVSALLSTCVAQIQRIDAPESGPDWYRAAAARRHGTWVAIGMVMAVRGGSTQDALSLLRAHAYSRDVSLDDLADDLVHERLPLADLSG